jgi:ABC-type transport system involved in cytochrome c biogenesis permease component
MKHVGLAVLALPLALPVVIAQTTPTGSTALAANAVDHASIRTLSLAPTCAVVNRKTDYGT